MNLDPSDGLALYTDGSAWYRDGIGGWAYVVVDVKCQVHLASGSATDTTNNRMEMQAAIEGLRGIHKVFGSTDVLMYSDSEYVVLGCRDRSRKRNKNKDLWKALDAAIDLHSYVEFEHVKGHSGNKYNELADQLAGSARKHGA